MAFAQLPFLVRPIRPEVAAELEAVVALRSQAYGKHGPALGRALAVPEPDDAAPDCTVLAAFSKSSGEVQGTLRIHRNGLRPLPLEASVELPQQLRPRRLAEVTRLARREGAHPMVKLALFKAFYLFCREHQTEVMLAAGRAPLDRQYEALLFEEVFPGAGYLPMRHAGGLPHRVLMLEISHAFERWTSAAHPLLAFMVEVDHPDILSTAA